MGRCFRESPEGQQENLPHQRTKETIFKHDQGEDLRDAMLKTTARKNVKEDADQPSLGNVDS